MIDSVIVKIQIDILHINIIGNGSFSDIMDQ